jgi:hypothetical protein
MITGSSLNARLKLHITNGSSASGVVAVIAATAAAALSSVAVAYTRAMCEAATRAPAPRSARAPVSSGLHTHGMAWHGARLLACARTHAGALAAEPAVARARYLMARAQRRQLGDVGDAVGGAELQHATCDMWRWME